MNFCSGQCSFRQTIVAVLVGVSPIVLGLLFLAFARLILHHLEVIYYRRQKTIDRRRSSFIGSQTGRLALSYTPVSHAELQRIIQGEYQTETSLETARRTPKFIKSILTKREPTTSSTSILANLVIRRDAIDATSLTGVLAPVTMPLQPTFTMINEKESRRPSVITIKRNSNSSMTVDVASSEPIPSEPSIAATKTTTTTTVVVEEVLEFHSVSSLPCTLTLLNSITDDDKDKAIEDDQDQESQDADFYS